MKHSRPNNIVKKIETGISGIDKILNGGIPEYSTILISGRPGTGKTILTQNILHNIGNNENVLYFTTLSEPQVKLIRYQQQFSFFNKDNFMKSVIYKDLGDIIRKDGIEKTLEFINRAVKEYQPKILAIDSFKSIRDILITDGEYRSFINNLNINLSLWECTVLLVSEYTESNIHKYPEGTIVDGIIYLYGPEERRFQTRYLRILKMRGTDFISGEHMVNISEDGINVLPRMHPVNDESVDQSIIDVTARVKTGIKGLDKMINGGLPCYTTTLISGETGTGKTLVGMKWLYEGVKNGESVLMVSFEEGKVQILRGIREFNWEIDKYIEDGLFNILYKSPLEVKIDSFNYEIKNILKNNKYIKK